MRVWSPSQTSGLGVPCAEIMKALSDETRLGVVRLLCAGPMPVGGLQSRLRVEATLLSHHLKVLREAGLVEYERCGRALVYRLVPEIAGRRRNVLDFGCCELKFASQLKPST